jgi:DNA repair exonuclease SbcCD ATPase subunit
MERTIKKITAEYNEKKDVLENNTRELEQCKTRLEVAVTTIDKHTKLSDDYRKQLVDQETVMTQQHTEVTEILIQMETNKAQLDRIRDEKYALTKANERMTEEIQTLTEKNTQLEAEKTSKGPVKRLNPNQLKE